MTQSDKDPFWQPPKDYSKLPNFNKHFEHMIKERQKASVYYFNNFPKANWKVEYPPVTTNDADQRKLRDFLKNLECDTTEYDAAPRDDSHLFDMDYEDNVTFKEWCEVYDTLKGSVNKTATLKQIFDLVTELNDWCWSHKEYYETYLEYKLNGKNK